MTSRDDDISDNELKEAYYQAARIIAEHGKVYLPIFERLEKEYHERQKNSALFKRAIKLAENKIP